jgi:hypothetical protein
MSFRSTVSYENRHYYKILLRRYESCIINSYIMKSNSGPTVTVLYQISFATTFAVLVPDKNENVSNIPCNPS